MNFKALFNFARIADFLFVLNYFYLKEKCICMCLSISNSDDAYCIIFGESMRKNEKVSRHFNKIFKITSPFFRLQYFDSLRRFRASRDN